MSNIDSHVLFTKNDYIYRAYTLGVITRQKLPTNGKYYTEEVVQATLTKNGVPVVCIDNKNYKLATLIAKAFKPINLRFFKIKYLDGNKQNCNFENMDLIAKDSEMEADKFKYQVYKDNTSLGVYTAEEMQQVFGLNASALNSLCDSRRDSAIGRKVYEIHRIALED